MNIKYTFYLDWTAGNRGDDGIMVFEPSLLTIQPGDTVRFVTADRGHNAETIDGMIPKGASGFEGRLNEEVVFRPISRAFTPSCWPTRCK